jgi:hypothetical protein
MCGRIDCTAWQISSSWVFLAFSESFKLARMTASSAMALASPLVVCLSWEIRLLIWFLNSLRILSFVSAPEMFTSSMSRIWDSSVEVDWISFLMIADIGYS